MKKLAIENELGHFDLSQNRLPKNYVHVSGKRLRATCRSLGIRSCQAVITIRKGRGGKPIIVNDGVVISARQEARLRVGIERRDQRAAKTRQRREAAESLRREQYLNRLRNLTIAEAIGEGCNAMFRLNRAAKLIFSNDQRREIYDMKNRWIQFLYGEGFCDRCEIHQLHHEAKKCFRCSMGVPDDDYFECDSCNGTGVYRAAWTEQLIFFSFLVEGVRYSWHQPVRFVRFAFQLTNEMPIDLPTEKRLPTADRTWSSEDMEMMRACISVLERSGRMQEGAAVNVSLR